MRKKVYIIGSISSPIDQQCESKFYNVHMQLMQLGFDVINPLDRILVNGQKRENALKKNLNDLMYADMVYIMSCVDIDDRKSSIELKLAIDFNLTIINGLFDLPTIPFKNVKVNKKQASISK